MRPKFFQHQGGKAALPIFFPDATRAVVKMLDSKDVKNTGTPGVLVNTYHLWREVKEETLAKFGGIAKFMNWDGAVISDSGGFQVMSQVKKGVVPGKITDQGIIFKSVGKKKMIFTPEESIRFQYLLKTDLMVVLDDFTDPKASYSEAKESVERTIFWAERSKSEFNRLFKNKKDRPYLIGVVQGGGI